MSPVTFNIDDELKSFHGEGGISTPTFNIDEELKSFSGSSFPMMAAHEVGAPFGGYDQDATEKTVLTPSQERKFQEWIRVNHITDADDPRAHYDYRGLFLAGGGRAPNGHFPDTYKTHGHPTFSVESRYSRGPNDGGRWKGDTFIPPTATFNVDEELKSFNRFGADLPASTTFVESPRGPDTTARLSVSPSRTTEETQGTFRATDESSWLTPEKGDEWGVTVRNAGRALASLGIGTASFFEKLTSRDPIKFNQALNEVERMLPAKRQDLRSSLGEVIGPIFDAAVAAIGMTQALAKKKENEPIPPLDPVAQAAHDRLQESGGLGPAISLYMILEPAAKVGKLPTVDQFLKGKPILRELAESRGPTTSPEPTTSTAMEAAKGAEPGIVEMHAGVTPQDIIESAKYVGERTAKLMGEVSQRTGEALKAVSRNVTTPKDEGVVAGLKAMWEHHSQQRDAEFISRGLARVVQDVIPDQERQLLVSHYVEQPAKYRGVLDPKELAIGDWLRIERNKVSRFVMENDLASQADLAEGVDYLFHWWKNPKTGEVFDPMYGKFSQAMPQAKQRTHMTLEAGIERGLEPASVNPGELVGKSFVSATRAQTSRMMFEELRTIDAGGPVRSWETEIGEKPQEVKLLHDWDYVEKNLPQDVRADYVRFADRGKVYAVHNSIAPWVRAYFESPTYGKAMRLVTIAKQAKLSLSLFHAFSLGWQDLAFRGLKAPYDLTVGIKRGLDLLKRGDDEFTRALYRNGLETHLHPDVAPEAELFSLPIKGTTGKVLSWPFRASTQFIFRVVQPGLKMHVAHETLLREWPKLQEQGFTLDQAARQVTLLTDRLFSGEDWRMNLLENSRLMADAYYSPKARRAWQAALISPTWQKAHIMMVARGLKSTGKVLIGEGTQIDKMYARYVGGAVTTYVAANLYNLAMTKKMDGEAKWMVQNPGGQGFSIRAPWDEPNGDKAYIRPFKSLFEVPGFLTSPIQKTVGKLNPAITGTAEEISALKDRDYRRAAEAVLDAVLPISVGTATRPGMSTGSRILSGLGVPTGVGKSDAELAMADWYRKQGKPILSAQQQEERDMKRGIVSEMRKSGTTAVPSYKEAIAAGKLSTAEKKSLVHKAKVSSLVSGVSPMPLRDAIVIWDKATSEEKEELKGVIWRKIRNTRSHGSLEDKRLLQADMDRIALEIKAMAKKP